jgi:hypothetical protein
MAAAAGNASPPPTAVAVCSTTGRPHRRSAYHLRARAHQSEHIGTASVNATEQFAAPVRPELYSTAHFRTVAAALLLLLCAWRAGQPAAEKHPVLDATHERALEPTLQYGTRFDPAAAAAAAVVAAET